MSSLMLAIIVLLVRLAGRVHFTFLFNSACQWIHVSGLFGDCHHQNPPCQGKVKMCMNEITMQIRRAHSGSQVSFTKVCASSHLAQTQVLNWTIGGSV